MFKFFKEKIKSWLKKSEKEIEEKAEGIGKIIEKEKPEIKEIKGKKKKVKKEKVEEEKEELIEPLQKFTIGLQKFEPDIKKTLEKIKEKEIPEETTKEPETKEVLERTAPTIVELEEEIKEKKPSIFKRIKEKFSYKISEENFEEIFSNLEFLLLENNVALEAVEAIKKQLKQELIEKEIKKSELEQEIKEALKKAIENLLLEPDDLLFLVKEKSPFIILFFGINGTGKTTTIAKVANLLLKNKISCILAASDTFRAASIEQLQQHADKLKIKIIKHDYGADPAAVAFDAIKHAQAHKIQVVLIDTAGRMHTSSNLLKEMEKISRVTNPDLKIFIAESIAGNDAIQQAKSFNESIGIDASILTKTDVDEKGGTAISISYVTKKPILFLGTGQGMEDLELFDKEKFIEKLGL